MNSQQPNELPTTQEIYEVLRAIKDPEIGVNIVDLGLVYGVQIVDRVIHITYTVTSPMCPMSEVLENAMRCVGMNFKGILNCIPHLVFEPPWDPSMISAQGRKEMTYPL